MNINFEHNKKIGVHSHFTAYICVYLTSYTKQTFLHLKGSEQLQLPNLQNILVSILQGSLFIRNASKTNFYVKHSITFIKWLLNCNIELNATTCATTDKT